MTLDAVSGRRYGPAPVAVTGGGVAAFVRATGDDPARWPEHAPPAYAAIALFAAAPRFLEDPDVVEHTRSLIHSEQSFVWHGPLPVGTDLEVEGKVESVRSRGDLNVVSFGVTAQSASGLWLESASSFVMSAGEAASSESQPEPPHDRRGSVDPVLPAPLPDVGEPLPTVRRSASRGDLLRYAAATGDWNPIHWDHAAAVGAGLPGVVVHGLLIAAWVAQSAAAVGSPGPAPLHSIRLRFRAPLRPAETAAVAGTVTACEADTADLALNVSSGGSRLVTGSARVTR